MVVYVCICMAVRYERFHVCLNVCMYLCIYISTYVVFMNKFMCICMYILPVFRVFIPIVVSRAIAFSRLKNGCYYNPRKRANYSHGGHGLRAGLPLLRRTPPLLSALSPGRDCRCGRATCSGGADKSRG